jgi:hypothetical protein
VSQEMTQGCLAILRCSPQLRLPSDEILGLRVACRGKTASLPDSRMTGSLRSHDWIEDAVAARDERPIL